ncbi:hypothetical protein B0T26DRAFT_467657 [Lasiosphaeria miniovina]|uniref:Uncharacterized protein n=1 Tax=Lasiosphaeria miniovina TaxID=1954250 RepID=A0AA40DKL8_9PEZI|nr:uncharacterized protein B0T26DRAFT_467657 [Lasiosphaeria miniovina]KAK0706685.1 hypothetical protein B0T26DRAFT_467657 [Lasiosphaeria miniovina]
MAALACRNLPAAFNQDIGNCGPGTNSNKSLSIRHNGGSRLAHSPGQPKDEHHHSKLRRYEMRESDLQGSLLTSKSHSETYLETPVLSRLSSYHSRDTRISAPASRLP